MFFKLWILLYSSGMVYFCLFCINILNIIGCKMKILCLGSCSNCISVLLGFGRLLSLPFVYVVHGLWGAVGKGLYRVWVSSHSLFFVWLPLSFSVVMIALISFLWFVRCKNSSFFLNQLLDALSGPGRACPRIRSQETRILPRTLSSSKHHLLSRIYLFLVAIQCWYLYFVPSL